MNKNQIFTIGAFLILLIAIPITIYLVKQQQTLKSRADSTTKVEFLDENGNVITQTLTTSATLRIVLGALPSPQAPTPVVSTAPSPINPATDTSYDMKVLVIKYFPLTADGKNIDINVTGDVGDSYSVIKQRTTDITNNLKTSLEKSTSYLGYKNPSAQPALKYTILDTKEYTQAVPMLSDGSRKPDYKGIMTTHNICDFVDNKGVKEVWLWAYQGPSIFPPSDPNDTNPDHKLPYLHIWESTMAGPNGFFANGGDEHMPVCAKTYMVYTFNYGRFTAEALHSWGHQIEAEMKGIDSTLWGLFQGPHDARNDNKTARCGDVHSPANAKADYDYSNSSNWNSDCLDWTPDNLGTLSPISCSNWGCSDVNDANNSQLNYLIWMHQNIPGRGNTKTYQGKQLRNWWDVHGDFDNVMTSSKRLTQ